MAYPDTMEQVRARIDKMLWAGQPCPGCGQFLSEGHDHSPNLIDGGIHYTYCKRCGWEQMS